MKNLCFLLLIGFMLSISGCIKDDSGEFKEINSFIRTNMEARYFWNERVPDNDNGSIPPGAYFGSILHPEDEVSFIVEDVELFENDLSGQVLTTGISASFGRLSNTIGVFIIVEFVYPGTPADLAGFKRGDIILEIEGVALNTINARALFFNSFSSATYGLGVFNSREGTITSLDSTVTVSKGEFDLNPIVYKDILEVKDKKIGYLFYSRFLSGEEDKYIDSVNVAFAEMKSQGVTEMIVDLRHNEGGNFDAALNLANALVSPAAAQREEVFVRFEYNNDIQQKIIDEEGANSDRLMLNFSEKAENLGLTDIYFLTNNETSSTSELLISGLVPHMNVTLIGEPTSGMFFGTEVILGSDANPANDYAIVPVTLRYSNSVETNKLSEMLQPDILIFNNLILGFQLGDINDPSIAAVLELISPSTENRTRSLQRFKRFEILEDQRAQKLGSVLFHN
ncbi:MAG: S41 family peptidase [Balneola sp.]